MNEDEEHKAIACKINDATNVHIKAKETNVEDFYSDDDAKAREEPKFPAPKLTRHSSIPPPVPARPLSRIISVNRVNPVSIPPIEVEPDHSSDNQSSDSFDSDSDDNSDDDTDDAAEETIVIRNSSTSSRPTSTTPSVHSK